MNLALLRVCVAAYSSAFSMMMEVVGLSEQAGVGYPQQLPQQEDTAGFTWLKFLESSSFMESHNITINASFCLVELESFFYVETNFQFAHLFVSWVAWCALNLLPNLTRALFLRNYRDHNLSKLISGIKFEIQATAISFLDLQSSG